MGTHQWLHRLPCPPWDPEGLLHSPDWMENWALVLVRRGPQGKCQSTNRQGTMKWLHPSSPLRAWQSNSKG